MTRKGNNKGAETMTSNTHFQVVRICTDCLGGCNCSPKVSHLETLELAVEWTKLYRENGDGSYRVELRNADGSLVTRGQVRAAGIKA